MVRKRSQMHLAQSRSMVLSGGGGGLFPGGGPGGPLKKSSSCSTIFLDDSTVSQPNLKNTIKCVALAIYYHIKNRASATQLLEIFDEKIHPLTVSKTKNLKYAEGLAYNSTSTKQDFDGCRLWDRVKFLISSDYLHTDRRRQRES